LRLNRHAHRTERTVIRLILGVLGALIVLVGLGIFGYKAYLRFEGDRLIRRAHDYFEAGDSKSAALTAGRAFQLNGSNVEAARILAAVGDRDGISTAIGWRQQVVALVPDSVEDSIALAKTALQFHEVGIAEGALSKVSNRAEQLPSYHDAAAQLAAAKNDSSTAEKELTEALKLAPANKLYQLKLALLQLQSKSRETRDRASSVLEHLLEDAESRAPAVRALRDNAARNQDGPSVLDYSARLQGYPEATFRDRLSYVQVLRALNRHEFASKLSELQTEAAKDPGKLTILLSWMSANNLAVMAIDWVKRLPPDALTQRPVPAAVADCYVVTEDWNALSQWCKKTDWHDLEFLRHAYLARAARGHEEEFAARSEWNAALQNAGANGDRILSLEQTAAKWGWKKEAEELLWTLGKNPEKQRAALASLNQYYTEKGQTADLYRVVARLSEINPDDESVQNNLTQLSLLLNLNVDLAQTQAEELYRKHPGDAIFASTYAFSLYHRGLFQQAVKVMDKLKPGDLLDPSVSAYYGIFLAAAGDKVKAAEYLERGSKASLFPEEKALVEKAHKTNSGSAP
jgi:Flp pilus assembly protein TadD